jgi:hypothetical protein
MTFISVTEPSQQGLVTYDQNEQSVVFFTDNDLSILGDLNISGTVNCNFIGNIFTTTTAAPSHISISNTLSGNEITIGDTKINNGVLTTDNVTGETLSVQSANVGAITTITTNLGTNNVVSEKLKAGSIQADIFSISKEKNVTKIKDISVTDLTTLGNINLDNSKFTDSNIITRDLTVGTLNVDDTSLTDFSNITSDTITADKFTSTTFSILGGSISTRDITGISTLSGSSLNIFDNIPSMEISKEFIMNGNLQCDTFTVNSLTGATVTMSGNKNIITGTGSFSTDFINVLGDITTTKISSVNSGLEITDVSFLNGVSLFDSVLSFKTINNLNNISGDFNNNSSGSNIIVKEVSLSGDLTTTKLIPNKIITESINADNVNDSIINTDITTNSITGNDFTFSGQLFVENIKASRTLTIDANVDIETTLFDDGNIDTYSIITCRLLETPLLTGVTLISSVEHYFEDSVINTVSFDDDGIITAGDYETPTINCNIINLQTITNPTNFNTGTEISSAEITGRHLNTGKISTTDNIINDSITSQVGHAHTIVTDTITITLPTDELKDNTIIASNLKSTDTVTINGDVFADTFSVVNTDFVYKHNVHLITDVNLSYPPSGTAGSVNGVKFVKGQLILLKDQTDPVQNGIYLVSDNAWPRHTILTGESIVNVAVSYLDIIYLNTANPCIVDTDGIIFSEYSDTILNAPFIINDTNVLDTGSFTSTGNFAVSNIISDDLTIGSLGLSSGLLDTPQESSINGMTTLLDHLENVTDIASNSIEALNVAVTDLEVQNITGKSTFGGIEFDSSSISANDIDTQNIDIKGLSLSGDFFVSSIENIQTNNISIVGGKITAQDLLIDTFFGIRNVSIFPGTGTYDFLLPLVYSPETTMTAFTRTGTLDNEWSIIPDEKPFGNEYHVQYNHNSKLYTTNDLLMKQTSILRITLSSNGYSLKNVNPAFVNGTYNYSDVNVSFNVVVDTDTTLTDIVVNSGSIFEVKMDIPVSNSILKTTKLKLNDLYFSDYRLKSANDTTISTPGEISIPSIVYNNAKINEHSVVTSITNGTITISENGSFIGVNEPTIDADPVTKNYVDANLQTFTWTDSVDYVYEQNVDNYDGTSFDPVNMIFVDGINFYLLNDEDIILLIGQIDPVQNGIFRLHSNRTILTRLLTGQVAGSSTHIKLGNTKKDSVYVCVGTSVIAGTDKCIYTQIIEGEKTFSGEIINNGEINKTTDFVIANEKLTASSIHYSKMGKTGFGIQTEIGTGVITIGNNVPTQIAIADDKSFLSENESYDGNKNFTNVTSDQTIISDNVSITGNAKSNRLPFLDGEILNVNNINNLSSLDNYDTEFVFTVQTDIQTLTEQYTFLLGQDDPNENGLYYYNTVADIPKPFVVNSRYIINEDFIQNAELNTLISESIVSQNISSGTIQTQSIKSNYRTAISETLITDSDILANTLSVRELVLKDTQSIAVDASSFSNVTLSGTGSYAENTVILIKNNTITSENGVYIVKSTVWPKIFTNFAEDQNGVIFKISKTGIVTPFIASAYDFSNVNSIGSAYTADYYSDKPLHLVGSFVDGVRLTVNETVLVKDDGIYKFSNNNWIKTDFLQDNEICNIQKGTKYSKVSFILKSGKTELNYDFVVDYIIAVNVFFSTSYPDNTKVLLTGQTNSSENGLYIASSGTLVQDVSLSGLNTIISLENFDIITAEDNVVFYAEPSSNVDYYNEPQNPFVRDTYTDGINIYIYTVNNVFELVRVVDPIEYIYISNTQKILHNGSFVNYIAKPATSVKISGVNFSDNKITDISELHSSAPEDDVIINVPNIGSKLTSSMYVQSDVINANTIITKSFSTEMDNFTSNVIDIKGSLELGTITFSDLQVHSNVTINGTKIKQTGTKVSDVITSATVPVGIPATNKVSDLILVLHLGIFKVTSNVWTPVLDAEEPIIHGNDTYTFIGAEYVQSALDITTDIHTKIVDAVNATVENLSTNDLITGTFNSDKVDIINAADYVYIGKRYIITDALYLSDLALLSGLDPLSNSINTSGRGFINDIKLSSTSKVLLVGQSNSAENGLYQVNTTTWTLISNPDDLNYKINEKYYNHLFVEIFPNENTIINTTTGSIDTPFYVTETKIDSVNAVSGVFNDISNTLLIGSSSTEINTKSINISGQSTFENLTSNNLEIDKNFIPHSVVISGNISSEKILKFDKSASLNSVDITNVNDLQVNKSLSCDSIVTPSITHDGSFDINSLVADTVIEAVTLTNKNIISIPEFNNYPFSGLYPYSNVDSVFVTNISLFGEHSNVYDGDIVIINEPLLSAITEAVVITNATTVNQITMSDLLITSVVVNKVGYSAEFRQTSKNTAGIYIIDTSNNAHGYMLGNKIPINVDISITLHGNPIPANNGVYVVVKDDAWTRIVNEQTSAASIDVTHFYKTNTQPIKVILPFNFESSVPEIDYPHEHDITKLSNDTFIIDISNGYTTDYIKTPSSGTFRIIDNNKNAIQKNMFIRSDKIYIQDTFQIIEKTWVRVNYVAIQNVLIPTLDVYQPITIGNNVLKENENIFLINQTNVKENGLYVLQSELLVRPLGYNEQDPINEFVWDSVGGYGFYIFGTLGNYISVQKTDISHPHASEKLIVNKLITDNITCPLPQTKLFTTAPMVLLETENINAENINITTGIITTPNLLMSGTLSANGDIKMITPSIVLEQNIYSVNSISISGKQNILINGLTVTQDTTLIDHLKSTSTSIKILDTDLFTNTNDISISDFDFSNVNIKTNNFNVTTLDTIPDLVTNTLNTQSVIVDTINTVGSLLFSDENVLAMRFVGSTIDIPTMKLPKIESSPQGPTNTSIFTNATNHINAFTKSSTINFNTISKAEGYDSQLNVLFDTVSLNAKELQINRSMVTDTENLFVYGDITAKKINASKNLRIGADGENVILGQNFFNISSKLNTINFTTDLELESFLGHAHGVSVGNRKNTGILAISGQKTDIKGKEINISYLKDVPAFKWQTDVDIICDYPLDISVPVYLVNEITLIPDMTLLLSENERDNGVYLVNGNNTLVKINDLVLSFAYSEKLGQKKSFYVNSSGTTTSNDQGVINVTNVDLFTPTGQDGYFETYNAEISNSKKIIIKLKFKLTSQFVESFSGLYYNNGHKIRYIKGSHTIEAQYVYNDASERNSATLVLEEPFELGREYTLTVTYDLIIESVSISLLKFPHYTTTILKSGDPEYARYNTFSDTFILGYDHYAGTGRAAQTFKNGTIYDVSIDVLDETDEPTNTIFFVKDVVYDVSSLTTANLFEEIAVDFHQKHVFTFDFKLRITQVYGSSTPTIFSCNNNRVYYRYGYGFYASFSLEGTVEENGFVSFLQMSVAPNIDYTISATFDYVTPSVSITVNGLPGTLQESIPTNFIRRFNYMNPTVSLGHIAPYTDSTKSLKKAKITNFSVSSNGYAPVIPKTIDVSDTLKIVGTYIPGHYDTIKTVKVDTNLLDRRSTLSVTPGGYLKPPYTIVKSSNTFTVAAYGYSGRNLSTTAPLDYYITLFDYSRIDSITLPSGVISKNFIFTDTKYKFDRSLESIRFNFEGHKNLVMSGEVIDSYNTIRKSGYTNFNTWIITVKRISTEDINTYNVDLKYNFIVREYPRTITTTNEYFPAKSLSYNTEKNQYLPNSFTQYNHTVEALFLKKQLTFTTESLSYVDIRASYDWVTINGAPITPQILDTNDRFRLLRIPNIYNLKSGSYTSHVTNQAVNINYETKFFKPNSKFNNKYLFNINHSISPRRIYKNISVSHAEKYRLIPIVSYPTTSTGNVNIYYFQINENGNIIDPNPETEFNIRLKYLNYYQNVGQTTGASVHVLSDYIFIAIDKTTSIKSVKVPLKNQPEFSFPSRNLIFKPQTTTVQVVADDNTVIPGTSTVFNDTYGYNIYKVPNSRGYTPGIYFDYKFNKTQGLRRTIIMPPTKVTFMYSSSRSFLLGTSHVGKGAIIENIDIKITSGQTDRRAIIIPSLNTNGYIYYTVFPENGSDFTQHLFADVKLRLSYIEINFDIDTNNNTFDFEVPVNMTPGNVYDSSTLSIPGGKVVSSSVSVSNNRISGTVIPSGPKLYQGTYYHGLFDLKNHENKTTVAHITTDFVFFAIKIGTSDNITIPVFNEDKNFENVKFSEYDDFSLSVVNSNMVVTPKKTIPDATFSLPAIYYGNSQVSSPEKVMSLLPNNVLIKETDPLKFKNVLQVNNDSVVGGIYNLDYDKNTHTLAFFPERVYSASGSAEALFRYKIEINSLNQIVVEKKLLHNDVSATDNESFRLSVYKVPKPSNIIQRRIYTQNGKAVINVPKKSAYETNNVHFATITMNIVNGYSEIIYKTNMDFTDFVTVKFEEIEKVTFACEKISSNEFKIMTNLWGSRTDPIVFQVMFIDDGLVSSYIPITSFNNSSKYVQTTSIYTYNNVTNLPGLWILNNGYRNSNFNDCITYVSHNKPEEFEMSVIKNQIGSRLYAYFIPKKRNTSSTSIYVTYYQILTQHEQEKGMVVSTNDFTTITTLNTMNTNLGNNWRYVDNKKYIKLPYRQSEDKTLYYNYYFYPRAVGYFSNNTQGIYYKPQNWCVIGYDNKYIVTTENILKNDYSNNPQAAFDAFYVVGTIFQDVSERKINTVTYDTMADKGISCILETNDTSKRFKINTTNSTFDPTKYESVIFTVFYKDINDGYTVKAVKFDGSQLLEVRRSGLSSTLRGLIPDDNYFFNQPKVVNQTISGNILTLELSTAFTGTVRTSALYTSSLSFSSNLNKSSEVKSVSKTYTNGSTELVDFKNNNKTVYISAYSTPYPGRFSTDFFNSTRNIMNTKPLMINDIVSLSPFALSPETAIVTRMTNRLSYVFRINIPSSYSKTYAEAGTSILNYPELLDNLNFSFKVVRIGPLDDLSYNITGDDKYSTYARIDTSLKQLRLNVKSVLGTPWSNKTYWQITILPTTETYNTVNVVNL